MLHEDQLRFARLAQAWAGFRNREKKEKPTIYQEEKIMAFRKMVDHDFGPLGKFGENVQIEFDPN